jgi:hypothetical protein
MLKPKQIPIDVVREMHRQMIMPGADPRCAIAAVLNAWPGMLIRPSVPDGVWHSYDCSRARIILPLPEKGEI